MKKAKAAHGAQVVAFKPYVLARRAADVLRGLLHGPEWLVDVRAKVSADGQPFVLAVVNEAKPHIVAAFPASVDGIKVTVTAATRPFARAT